MKPTLLMLMIMCCFLSFTACKGSKKAKETLMEEKMNKDSGGFSLQGNEPFWNVEISDDEIVLKQMDGDDIVYPYYAPKDGAFSRIFETSTEVKGKTSNLKIIVEQKTCNDTMADISYDYKVTVVKDGMTMKGCGSKK